MCNGMMNGDVKKTINRAHRLNRCTDAAVIAEPAAALARKILVNY